MKKPNKEIILKLKRFLDDFHYHFLLTSIVGESEYFTNPLPDYNLIKREIKKVPMFQQQIINFLFLGEPVEKDFIEKTFEKTLLSHLYDLEIINLDEEHYWLNNYVITSYCNCYFLVSNVYYYPTCQNSIQRPYIGPDTYWLSRLIIGNVYGDVLDLCTGSGIQAILAAKTAETVTAIDCDPIVCNIALFNTMLNNTDEKVRVLCGDLYSILETDEKFDFITSNPPFIPIPKDIPFPICGDGGEDGREIIRHIIQGYSLYLKKDGQAFMIGQSVGDKEECHLCRDIDSCLTNMSSQIYINNRSPIERQAQQFFELAKRINGDDFLGLSEWENTYKLQGITCFYNFTLFVRNKSGMHDEIYYEDTWYKNDIPNLTTSNIKKADDVYMLYSKQGDSIVVDAETAAFLQVIDGKKTIETVINELPFIIRAKHGTHAQDKLVAKYNAMCSMLERYNVISKANSK